jgi:hypothetical protein
MDKLQIEEILRTTINRLPTVEDGWINLANLGLEITKNGIDYKALGYEKLVHFIKANTEILTYKKDESKHLPVYFVKLKDEKKSNLLNPTLSKKTILTSNNNPKSELTNWAYLGHYQTTINKLKALALDERWFYSNQDPNYPFPILVNYLHYTFYKLTKEKGKILYSDDFAVFNTGLVDKRYEPIFALFQKNKTFTQEWCLSDFCITGEGFAGKNLVRHFNKKPEAAHYFDNVSDMLYDVRSPKPELDWQHIIIENIDRLPFEFISDNAPFDFVIQRPESLSIIERKKYYNSLASAIENDTKAYRNITNRLKDALELALKRVKWNFKSAIPMYYPTMNKMSLLLPLSLVDDEIVDVSLVVEKTASDNYLGHTILPLSWAYSNARLVCRPDSDWLVAENIVSDISISIDSED